MGFIYGFDSLLKPMYSYWFLIALVVWRLTAHHIAGFKEIQLILFGFALFAGFFDSIDNTFAVSRIIGFYPFYMMGYLITKEKSEAMENSPYPRRILIGSGAALITAIIAFASQKFFSFSDSAFQMFPYRCIRKNCSLHNCRNGNIYTEKHFTVQKNSAFNDVRKKFLMDIPASQTVYAHHKRPHR